MNYDFLQNPDWNPATSGLTPSKLRLGRRPIHRFRNVIANCYRAVNYVRRGAKDWAKRCKFPSPGFGFVTVGV